MKEISNNIDENKLWRLCFPHFLPRAEAAGVFVMASAEVARKRYQDQPLSDLPLEKAELRLELACAALWDSVKDLFLCDFFPANDLEYSVFLEYKENGSTSLKLEFKAGDRENAENTVRTISKNKDKIYKDLYKYIMELE